MLNTNTITGQDAVVRAIEAVSLIPLSPTLTVGSVAQPYAEGDFKKVTGTVAPTGLTVSQTVATDAKGNLISTNLVGTAAQVAVAGQGTGTTTVSLPAAITVPGTLTVGGGNLRSAGANFFTATGAIASDSSIVTLLGLDGSKVSIATPVDANTVTSAVAGNIVRRDASANVWLNVASLLALTNQLLVGTGPNITTVTFPASAGAVTLTMPNQTATIATLGLAETLVSKTLTAPTINAAALSGTLSGTPTFSGNVVFSNVGTSIAATGDVTMKRYSGEWQCSGVLSVVTATETPVQFGSVVGSLTNVPALTATSTVFTPTKAGKWLIGAQVVFAANATGVRLAYVRKNGSSLLRYNMNGGPAVAALDLAYAASWPITFNGATDYVECICYQTSGGNLIVGGDPASSGSISRFCAEFLHE